MSEYAKEFVSSWDRGDSVWSIEMGGLGPGYEQAIQVCFVEIVRDHCDLPLPEGKSYRMWGDDTINRIDKDNACGGFSGAQVGAAKQLAFRLIRDGAEWLKDVPQERKILVSNFWPSVKGAA